MHFADRLPRLGTESAFEVSRQALEWQSKGHTVYPFHLGDLNIPTPENIVEAMNRAIRDGRTGYCPPAGIPELRAALAEDVGKRRGLTYGAENVAIQPGGKPLIGKFILAFMNGGDEVLYPNPGYPIYESQIEFHGGVAVPYTYRESEQGFRIDLDEIRSKITPRTRLLITNNCHNPSGAESPPEELEGLAEVALEHDLWVLSDEAYFEIRYAGESTSIASLPGMQERTVVLYTFSKKFAMTGWRLGAAIASRDVIEVIAELNVNAESCSNHFIQWAMIEALTGPQEGPSRILDILRERRDVAGPRLQSIDGIRVTIPQTTFYLFPNVTEVVKRKGSDNISSFQQATLEETGVAFCTRNHFGRPQPGETECYIRFAYSGIDIPDIEKGLSILKDYFEA
ncbi:MAG: pyridoxal phosphate-dependent aminotransferase [Fidelibacterota bacterium]